MARVTACFALSAVVVLAIVIRPGNGQLPVPVPTDPVTRCLQFPGGQFPSTLLESYKFLDTLLPMRIFSKGNTSLSMTAGDKGEVYLAPGDCRDTRQLWVQHPTPIVGKSQFSLVNVNYGSKDDPLRAMQISDDGSYPVKLAPYNPLSVPSSMLWTQDTKLFGDGFYKIRSYKDTSLVLDGLGENVHNGTVVGAYPAPHDGDHILWKTRGFLFES